MPTRQPTARAISRSTGSGWEQFLQFGNTLLQDKIMVGLSRYLFGTSFEELIKEYQELPLKEKVMEKWLYGNAADLLPPGLKAGAMLRFVVSRASCTRSRCWWR